MPGSPSRRSHDFYVYEYPQHRCYHDHRRRPSSMLPDMDGPLSLPVIIPQQRPGSKQRGFMAAYAPSLEECDVSRLTFLQFVDECNSALQGNKVLSGIQTVSACTPEMIVMGAATAIRAAAHAANRAHVRHKMNAVLDKYNEHVFGPRGLFCMVMKYEPELRGPSQSQSYWPLHTYWPLHQIGSLARATSVNSSSLRDPVFGKIQGADHLPTEVAPLMYIDDRRQHKELLSTSRDRSKSPSTSSDGKKASSRNTVKGTFEAVNDYLDRRARARYAAENTDDVLNVPPSRPFKSRYLDPNHPATNGGFLGLISGGVLTPDSEARKRRKYDRIREEERLMLEQYYQQMESIRKQNQSALEIDRQLRRCQEDYGRRFALFRERRMMMGADKHITEGILFLAIVNRPSDAELATAGTGFDRDYGSGVLTAKELKCY